MDKRPTSDGKVSTQETTPEESELSSLADTWTAGDYDLFKALEAELAVYFGA